MIECEHISKIYQTGSTTTYALRDVSFSIKDGEFVAIMGPSGSGKSTLMHILGALDVPSSGTYSIDGKDISKFTQDELADLRKNSIGFVFQSFNLLKRTTLVRNVMIPLIYAEVSKKEREQKAKDALGMVEIDESHFYHHPNEISGGQMQRVAIARALINNPSLILADEPTGNLDTHTGDVVLQTFQKLNKKENKTIVLITHERYVAEHADRIITIVDGGLVGDTTSFSKRTARPIHAV